MTQRRISGTISSAAGRLGVLNHARTAPLMVQLAVVAIISGDTPEADSSLGKPVSKTRRMADMIAASTSGSNALWRRQAVLLPLWVCAR